MYETLDMTETDVTAKVPKVKLFYHLNMGSFGYVTNGLCTTNCIEDCHSLDASQRVARFQVECYVDLHDSCIQFISFIKLCTHT